MGTLKRLSLAAAAVVAVSAAPVHAATAAQALTVRTSFAPPAVRFGDRVVARVVVTADRDALDTNKLLVTQDVAPLTSLGPAKVTRTTRGGVLIVSYELPAVCLSGGCLAGTGPKLLRLPPARAEAPRTSGGVARAASAWPVLTVGSRVTAADLKPSRPPFRADTVPPAVTYRIAPHTLLLLLYALAAVLGAGGVAFAAWQVAVLGRIPKRDTRTVLERALALVREAESQPVADRRRAVGFLARVLHRRDEKLARVADDLAWSEPKPAPDELAALADRVGDEVGTT
jgi:hypothetical protein